MDEAQERGGGHLTTTVRRPANRRASDAGRSRLVDNRRQRIASRRPLPRVRTTWLFGLAALVVAGAIAAALFGLPVRTWFDQDNELQALEHELTEMQAVNHDLEGEVDRLQTDDGIREAAREELGHIQSGDKRETMLELPPLPTDLPDGWPYSQVEAVMALRASLAAPPTSDAAAPTATATTVVNTTTTAVAPTTTAAAGPTTTTTAVP